MPFSHEFLQSFVETELTMRRQFLLRGYELGRGGGRLGPEAAVAFLDQHFSPVYADVIAATREEQRDFQRASETMLKDTEAWYRQISDMVEGKLDEASQIAASCAPRDGSVAKLPGPLPNHAGRCVGLWIDPRTHARGDPKGRPAGHRLGPAAAAHVVAAAETAAPLGGHFLDRAVAGRHDIGPDRR